MAFIDPSSIFVRWGTFTIPAGQTTATVTHGAAFIPTRVILFPKDAYAWGGQAVASNYSGLTFQVDLANVQLMDAVYEYVIGTN